MESNDTKALADKIKTGDREAEAEFYRRFIGPVRFVLRKRLGGDTAEAEDIAQEAMIVVLLKLRAGEIDDPERLGAYLQGTAKNLVIGKSRLYESKNTQTTPDIPEWAIGWSNDEVEAVLQQESANLVQKLLSELKQERDRQVLMQHYVMDKPKEVVCENLSLSPAHFDRVLYNAKARLKTLFDAHTANGAQV